MTFQKPVTAIDPKINDLDSVALITPTGFREYDARWWFGHPSSKVAPQINLLGIEALGLGLGTLVQELGAGPDIVVGHDYRSYSETVKQALVKGLLAAGANIKDIGLALSPTAYFAQFDLDVASVAMVTASHNPNGWTGVKMGADRPMTFGHEQMARLKEIVLNGAWVMKPGGAIETIDDFADRYICDLTDRRQISRKLRTVVACGNGTAGAFAPLVLERLGVDVIPMDTELDHTFPNYHPDPEDADMLVAMVDKIKETGADLAIGFDGDGDRCGIVDDEGEIIFADKVGVLLARHFAEHFDNKQFVVDVKSTSLFATDPILKAAGASTDYFKTGHSYLKQRVQELDALAGFEKSGHFFFNQPIGRGYDDAILTAIMICEMLDQNPERSLSDLRKTLPVTFDGHPLSAYCPDEHKYGAVEKIVSGLLDLKKNRLRFAGQFIHEINTINGARVTTEDGSWGLIRASSNEPKIVVVAESPVSSTRRNEIISALSMLMMDHGEIGTLS